MFADVGLRLEPGERRGLVGPNGAGKSTLLRLAAGTERPDAGTVEHFGVDVGRPRSRRATGWVPDGSPFPTSNRVANAAKVQPSAAQVHRIFGELPQDPLGQQVARVSFCKTLRV